jgi:hypothetical protein
MEKIKTLKFHNEILLNTSLYKYLSLINGENISGIIKDVIFDNFIQTTKTFLRNSGDEAIRKYKEEMRVPWQNQIDKTLRDGWVGIKNNLLVSSYITFDLFLNHLAGVYYHYFSKLYSNDDINISYSVIRDFKTRDELKNYFISIHVENFTSFDFTEKIQYIKKTLKLNDDEIWNLNGRDYLQDIYKRGHNIRRQNDMDELPDDEYYLYISYLCSLIFKLSAFSQIKFGIEFEWINNFSRYYAIADNLEKNAGNF